MTKPKWTLALTATFFALSFALVPVKASHAELVSEEEVQEDAIQAEPSEVADEIVIVKKRAAKPVARKVVRRAAPRVVEMEEPAMEEAVMAAPAMMTAQPVVAAAPVKASVGSTIDGAIQTKMDGVREQFEQAFVRQLDKIKISVDDGSSAQAVAPTQTTIVADQVVSSAAAPQEKAYIPMENAPTINEDGNLDEAAVIAKASDPGQATPGSIRVAPVVGITSLGSDYYNISARYTLGVNVEMDVDPNLAVYLGYSYSQYDVAMGNANPFYMNQPGLVMGSNLTSLQYNQNVFEGGMRLYMMPQRSKFRAFVGAGLGYNKGYLNYSDRYQYGPTYASNPFLGSGPDYEVTSYLGILEGGADFKVSRWVSIGGLAKYYVVLGSNENQPINNYGFVNNGYNQQPLTDKAVVGGSIAQENFYSVLGTVKIAF